MVSERVPPPEQVTTKRRGGGGGLVSRRVEMYESTPKHKNNKSQLPISLSNKFTASSSSYSRTIPAAQHGKLRSTIRTSNNTAAPGRSGTTTTAAAEPESRDARDDSGAAADQQQYAGASLIEDGVQQYALGDYEAAIQSFHTALKLQRVSVGDNYICMALTLGNLGAAYLQLGELDLAEQVLLESLRIKQQQQHCRRKVQAPSPPMSLADTLNNLGNCANLRGDYDTSLRYYRDALADLEANHHGDLPAMVNTNYNIGRLEIQRSNWEVAKRVLSEACRLTKQLYGPSHEFVAQTLDLMGFAQLSTAEYDAAMVSFTQALGLFRQLHGPLHLTVAHSLLNVGMVREAKGQLPDALEAYSTTKDLYLRLGATTGNHVGFQTVLESISNVENRIMMMIMAQEEDEEAKQQGQQQQQQPPPQEQSFMNVATTASATSTTTTTSTSPQPLSMIV